MDATAGIVHLIWVAVPAVVVATALFWVCALVDAVRREFPGTNDKLIWVLIILLASWLGALIYWFVGRPKGTLSG